MIDVKSKREATALRAILDLSDETHLEKEKLLVGCDLEANDIYDPFAEVAVWQELTVVENLLRQGGSLSLALDAAKRIHITSLGVLGSAMLASKDIQEALTVSSKYHSISLWLCDVAARLTETDFEIMVLPYSLPKNCGAFFAIRGIASLKVWFSEMLGRDITPSNIKIGTCIDESNTAKKFDDFFGRSVTFGATEYSISINPSLLYEPLKLSDPWALLRCEHELKKIKEKRRSSISNQVRDLISFSPQTNQSEECVSSKLGISGTTLRRRLREEGTTFRELRAESLHSLACRMLSSSSNTIDRISDVLGYSEATSFVRSFKRYEGISPGAWRKKLRLENI
jgi:AraC-like DNA-binding protein